MNCEFNSCEFINVVFGGIITGIIASVLLAWITNIISVCSFKRKYKHLKSIPDKFDWTAYSMKKEDGRVREDSPNGSSVNIDIKKGRIYLTLKQNDGRKWLGELNMDRFGFGIVSYKYVDKHEYGKRECFIGSYTEGGKTFDYLFLTPTNDKIYTIKKTGEDNLSGEYNYGDEIIIRERPSKS